jgi:vacuolar-type H+-ATPase subunit F/Vma7
LKDRDNMEKRTYMAPVRAAFQNLKEKTQMTKIIVIKKTDTEKHDEKRKKNKKPNVFVFFFFFLPSQSIKNTIKDLFRME